MNEQLFDAVENISEKLSDVGGKAFDKAKDFTNKLMDEADDAAAQAKKQTEGQNIDNIIEKAKEM